MSIRKRINKILACVLTSAMVLSCLANATPAFAQDVASGSGVEIGGDSGSGLENAVEPLYTQDFTGVTDASTVATSPNAQDYLTMVTGDATYGTYLSYSTGTQNSRGANMNFAVDVTALDSYVVEFDAALTAGNGQTSNFTVKGADFADNGGVNNGAKSGWLINMVAGANTTEWAINGIKTTIPKGEWCHYTLIVDKVQGLVSTTIVGTETGTILEKSVTPYDGEGNVAGIYMLAGRYYPVQLIDNIVVRKATDDEKIETVKEFTVSFVLNGHGDAIDAVKVLEGNSITAPVAPRAEGYVFRGWFTDEEFKTAWDFATGVTADTTLYARWIEDPTETNTSAWYSEYFNDVVDASAVSGNAETKTIATDDAHGYYLYLKATGGGNRTADMTFTGLTVSADKYVLEFDAILTPGSGETNTANSGITQFAIKGADFATDFSTGYILKFVNAGTGQTEYTVNGSDKTVTIPKDEWNHYKLVVDKTAKTVTLTITGATATIVEGMEVAYAGEGNVAGVYANFARYNGSASFDNIEVYEAPVEEVTETFTVTFNMNEHGTAIAPITVEYGQTVVEPTAPTADSYTFGGWYTDVGLTKAYDFATAVTADITLYAKWDENSTQGPPAGEEADGNLYTQDFTGVTDASTVATSPNAQDYLTMVTGDATYGTYLSYSTGTQNSRGANMNFAVDVTALDSYVVEFDAALTAGNGQTSNFTVKGADFADNGGVNNGAKSGWLINMVAGANTTEWAINGIKTTIPKGEWCHYTLIVDKAQGLVSTTIVGTETGTILEKSVTPYDGEGNVAGIYMLAGRYYPVQLIDNIVVRKAADDEKIEAVKEFTVSFVLNGHGDAIDAVKVLEGNSITAPVAPRAEGYVFRGWFTDEEFKTAWDFATGVTADTTLYARWIEDPAEVNTNAWYSEYFSDDVDASAVSGNAETKTIATDDAHGYYLYLKATGGGNRTADMTFTGLTVSADKYVLEFDAILTPGSGETNAANSGITQFAIKGADFATDFSTGYILKFANAGTGQTEYTVNGSDKTVTIPKNEWNHYKLVVDKTAKTVTLTITGATAAIVEDMEVAYAGEGNVAGVYANFARYNGSASFDNIEVYEFVDTTKATVSFNMNGHGDAIDAIVVTKGTAVTKPEDPGVAGWTFGGWYTDAECKTAYDFATLVTDNVTLYAKWDEAAKDGTEYTVVFEATGDTTTVDCSTLVFNDNVTGYMVTTSKSGKLVNQTIVKSAPTSVDTTGADKVEIAPVFFYEIGDPGKLGEGGYDIKVPSGTYDFVVYNTGARTDVYVNGQMLVNNLLQNGSTPNYLAVKDVVITGDNAKITASDSAGGLDVEIQIVKSPTSVERKQKVYVLGDSLVAIYYNGGNAENNLRTGWGQVLADYLTDDVDVLDLANSGVTANGLYTTAFSHIKGSAQAGDILLLESGYNDKSYDTKEVMKTAVTNMVTEAEALGVEVILVSPNASTHDYKESVAWTGYMAEVAEETGAKYIDLSKLSYKFLYDLYAGDTDTIYNTYNLPNEGEDSLHSSYNGANKWASVVAGAMYDLGYTSIVDTDYVYAFGDTAGNLISCNAVGKMAAGYVKVTFSMNGQSGKDIFQTIKEGTAATKPTSPSASGCVFGGWYKDAACTEEWDFATTISADTTIYAKWVELAAGTLYTQDFTDVTDASTVATSTNAQGQLVIKNDDSFGNYLAYDFSSTSTNSRGAYMDFAGLDVSAKDKYIVEFYAAITPGNNQETHFAVKAADGTFAINDGMSKGYIINLNNKSGGSDEYTLNDTQTVKIPSGEWCHYVLYVDKTQGLVSTTITGTTSGVIADKAISAYNGEGNVNGFYMRAGRYNPVISVDNILVREVSEYDQFGEVKAETLAGAVFTSQLNKVITQPAEGSPVHLPITIKGNGSLNGDLTDKVTVEWSVVGLEGEDGYISLTKAEGTGAGTDGEKPDGTTAYFNVRNGVSNWFGYVQAVVTYGEDSYTITTPFAVVGASSSNANQLAPAAGYPVSMDEYADKLVGYVGTANSDKGKDVVLNNWSIYGSNGARTMKLVEVDGRKALEFASNGGSGSTVAVYQWTDQKSQYVIDFTAKFTAKMVFGVYLKTPNNSGSNPEWEATVDGGSLSVTGGAIEGVNANEWYRFVITADASVQKYAISVYDMSGSLVGEVSDIAMTNDTSTQVYFCFQGTWPMYLNSFEAYLPTLSSIKAAAAADVVKVPESGEAAATVDLSAVLTSTDGIKMTSAVEWSLADEYANVEIASTGAQTATLTVNAGASGTVVVLATAGGKQAEVEIQLTTSSNVVSFKQSASSITIPFTGEDAVVADFVAVTRNGDGEEIDGGAITYTLLDKDGVTETTVKGVTFKNGVLTVEAGAQPGIVYVKATNAEGLSAKVKVNIHGLSFAFGSGEPADGFTQVVDTLYTAKLGYGFADTTGLTINADNVKGTADFRFKANVPNGNYTVKVTTSAASITSEVVESVSATTGIAKSGTSFSVAVCDGVLDLTFPANSTVTSIEISQTAPKSALEKPMVYAIGDSTTKNNASGALSWGNCVEGGKVIIPTVFGGFSNHGMAGRDSVSYYNQGRVEAVLLAICPGDYVTVNMGINSKETGEAASYETLLSEYYVEGILQRGGIPVIVTATPDGPVGDRVAGNYDSTTGKFTNNRGDGARNDVLRKIAENKGLAIIELGQWGQDWMNTLTDADVTAYNTEYGTEFTTVLEMVQSWYVDHNHYKEYLGVQIANYLLGQLKDMAVKKEVVIFDFENESSANWDMTGDLAGNVTIVENAEVADSKYLQLYKKEARTTTTTRTFAGMPEMMSEAAVEYKWYVGGQSSTNRAGFTGIKFMDGETEILTLFTGEMRAAGDTSSVYYSTNGIDGKVESGVKVASGSWYTVTINIDFNNDTADVYVDGAKVVTGVEITPTAKTLNAMAFVTVDPDSSTKVTPTVGIDDFSITYVEKTAEDDVVTIYSLSAISTVKVTSDKWAEYKHPTTVNALLTNGVTITVDIDAATWACENFDEKTSGSYVWTADIVAPAEYANTRNLKVSYTIAYEVPADTSNYAYYTDFENEASAVWEMSGDLASGLSIVTVDGNKYLQLSKNEARTISATRAFADMPKMTEATVDYKWYFGGQTSTSRMGYTGIKFMDGETEILSMYTGELRNAGETTNILYTTNGFDAKVDSGVAVTAGNWYTFSVKFDFTNDTATVYMNDAKVFETAIVPVVQKVDAVSFMTVDPNGGTKVTPTMGMDNFGISYVEKTAEDDVVTIYSLGTIENIKVSRVEWLVGYKHPTTVSALLTNGETIDVTIDANTWKCENFDKDVKGAYTWTANIIAPENYANDKGLTISYVMEYEGLASSSEHDYFNDFTFADEMIPNIAWGKGMDSTSGSGSFGLEHKLDENNNGYLYASVTGNGDRGSRLDLTGGIVKGTTFTFDWMPVNSNGSGNGQILFVSNAKWHSYFTLRFDKDYNLYAFTKNPLAMCWPEQIPFEGEISADNAINTGLGGQNKWFTVTVTFDYMAHTADLTITEKDNPENTFTQKGIKIDNEANGTRAMVIHMNKLASGASVAMGLDNIAVDYVTFGANDATAVKSPADVSVSKTEFAEFEFDETAKVTLGTGATVDLRISKWTGNLVDESGYRIYTYNDGNIIYDNVNNILYVYENGKLVYDASGYLTFTDKDGNTSFVCRDANGALVYDADGVLVYGVGTAVKAETDDADNTVYKVGDAVLTVDADGNLVDADGNVIAAVEFDANVAGKYLWTAAIDFAAAGYTDYFKLVPKFTMTYTMYAYPTFVYNEPTLELTFGDEFKAEFPTTATALMSNGNFMEVDLGEWKAIREFNADKEGIYVYGANVIPREGVYDVVADKLSPNENPADPSAQRADYVYDVYYRISYFKDEDNYNAYARTMENLDRGVYAVETEDGVFVSWRLLATEYGEDIAFNVYRNGSLVNKTPITNKTNFVDVDGRAGDFYSVGKIENGKLYESDDVVATAENYISIPVQKPVGLTDKDGNVCTYTMNDASTADVDGDGQYEIVIKWVPDDAFDSGAANGPSGPTLFDVYEMDGTALWRLNLGLELPSGAHFNQIMVYDMDEDGKAEVFLKTSDGSVTYRPNADGKFDMNDESTIVSYIGDKNVTPGVNINSNGHVAENSNEYVTVFNGMTGEEIDTIKYVNVTGAYADWGKDGDGGNRSARYNIGIAYLPEDQNDPNCTDTIPAVLFNRGYYNKTTVAAYTLRDGKLNLDWNFVTESGTEYAGKGNHNLATGDIDKDGFDELIIGAMAIDHDGTVLWVKNGKDGQDYAGHADSIHLAAMNPNSNDLYVFTPAEEQSSTLNYSLVNAKTGTRYIGEWFSAKDVGRGVAANITPLPGYESWAAANGSGLYAFDGTLISTAKNVPMSWVLYWDGDLLSEFLDGASTEGNAKVTKYNWYTDVTDTIVQFTDTKLCNWTKNTPSLTADLLGDWREEVVVRNGSDTELRIYMTTTETDYMIYTLMHDPVYRNSVAAQNSSYNQPSHVGFYLGEDNKNEVLNMQLDTANVVYATVDTTEEVKDALEDVTADNIIESVEEIGADKLADAMQNDAEVLDKVAEIENEYVENNGLEILAPEVDHINLEDSFIQSTVGIGFAADEDNSTVGMKFVETPREEQKPVDTRFYGKYAQIDITLEVDGVPVEGELDVPVVITMKLPKGLDINGIFIFHYHGDEETPELIKPVVNMNGTITFPVKKLSTFVFANKLSDGMPSEDEDAATGSGTGSSTGTGSTVQTTPSWNGKAGWQKINDTWYYFNANGSYVTGWVEDNNKWYFMNEDGSMATGWVCSPASGLWYYMDLTNGDMLSNGWLCDPESGRWYYLDVNGAMCTGWIIVDNVWYLLDVNGAMCTGWNLVNDNWYLLGSNGAMLTGWQEVGGKSYFMVETGECLINTTTPDGSKVDETGAKVN